MLCVSVVIYFIHCGHIIGRVPQTMGLAAIGLQPDKIYTLEEIEDATNNFDQSNLIEEGSEGQVTTKKFSYELFVGFKMSKITF